MYVHAHLEKTNGVSKERGERKVTSCSRSFKGSHNSDDIDWHGMGNGGVSRVSRTKDEMNSGSEGIEHEDQARGVI